LRLDPGVPGGLLGRAGFIHSFWAAARAPGGGAARYRLQPRPRCGKPLL